MEPTAETDITKDGDAPAIDEPDMTKENDGGAEDGDISEEDGGAVNESTEEDSGAEGESTEGNSGAVDENAEEDGSAVDENAEEDDFAPANTTVITVPQAPEAGDSPKRNPRIKKALKISGIVLASLAVIYIAGVIFYSSHFFFRTNINNFYCSNLSPEKATERLKTNIDDYVFTIICRDGSTETISGKDIALAYEAIGSLEEIKKKQNPFLWATDYSCRNLAVDISVSYDRDALYQKIASLQCVAASDASMEGAADKVYYDDANMVYGVTDSGADNIVSVNKIFDKAAAGITGLYPNMYLDAEGCYVGMADEDRMHKALEELNRCVSTKVTYLRGDDSSYLYGGSIHEWLTLNSDYTVTLDSRAVESWVESLADLYNTVGTARDFVSASGNSVTVYGGDYGWWVNTGAEAEALEGIIRNGEQTSREPIYKQTAGSHGPNNDLPDTYVEVSISDQHVWYFYEGSVLVSTDCVTGDPTKNHSTDTGIYYIKYKERNATLKGEDYETPVSYWMPFNGGQGLHDLSSRGAFGGSIYRGNGSHGCVNLPYWAAQSIYGSIEQGVPVVVH